MNLKNLKTQAEYAGFYMKDPKERLPELLEKLKPLFTEEQISAHLEHHKAYYDQLLHLKKELHLDQWSLEKIIGCLKGPVYNSAAQYWYHNMFWDSLTNSKQQLGPLTRKMILKTYDDVTHLQACLVSTSMNHFSNGWYGLVFDRNYTNEQTKEVDLRCKTFLNADVPMSKNFVPLLVVDLWEHSYYLDFKKDRKTYLEKLYNYLDWDVVEHRLNYWRKAYENYKGFWMQ